MSKKSKTGGCFVIEVHGVNARRRQKHRPAGKRMARTATHLPQMEFRGEHHREGNMYF